MWDIDNRTPFLAHSRFDRDSEGCTWYCVYFKLTVELRQGATCRTSPRQNPILMEPRFAGDPAATPLLAETDLCLTKSGTDVLLHGRVQAPHPGSPPMRIGLEVGDIRKAVELHSAQSWDQDLRLRRDPGDAFVDLGWVSGYGGVCPVCATDDPKRQFDANPLGLGYATTPDAARNRALPRLVIPGGMPSRWEDRPVPVGFGPVPATWPLRKRHAGTYDAGWAASKAPYLPDDFDDTFFRCAPADQQVQGHLQGGESIILHGIPIGSDGPMESRFVIPEVALEVMTRFWGSWQPMPMALSTLHLFPEAGMMTMLWQGRLRVGASQRDVDVGETRIALRGARQLVIHPDHVAEL